MIPFDVGRSMLNVRRSHFIERDGAVKTAWKILWRGLAGLVALLLLLLAGLILWQRTHNPWPAPVPGVRLEPKLPVLKPADVTPDNAFYYLRQIRQVPPPGPIFREEEETALKQAEEEEIKFRALGWEPGQYPGKEQWVRENQILIALLTQAAAQPPAQSSCPDAFSNVILIREVVRCLDSVIQQDAAEGRFPEAVRNVGVLLRTGRIFQSGGNELFSVLGIVFQKRATDSVRRILLTKDVPEPEQRMLQELLAVADLEMTQTMPGEILRYDLRDAIQCGKSVYGPAGLAGVGWRETLGNDWQITALRVAQQSGLLPLMGSSREQTKKHFEAIYSHGIAILDTPYYPQASAERFNRSSEFNLLPDPTDSPASRLFKNDPLGGILARRLFSSHGTVVVRWYQALAELRVTRIILAIKQYQAAHAGKAPESLTELTPAYLEKLPDDPFAGPGVTFAYTVRADGGWVLRDRRPPDQESDGTFASDEFKTKRKEYLKKEAERQRAKQSAAGRKP